MKAEFLGESFYPRTWKCTLALKIRTYVVFNRLCFQLNVASAWSRKCANSSGTKSQFGSPKVKKNFIWSENIRLHSKPVQSTARWVEIKFLGFSFLVQLPKAFPLSCTWSNCILETIYVYLHEIKTPNPPSPGHLLLLFKGLAATSPLKQKEKRHWVRLRASHHNP